MRVEFIKETGKQFINHLVEVEKLAWLAEGENILASREKILVRLSDGHSNQSAVLAIANGKAAGSQYAFRFNWDNDIGGLGSWDGHTCFGWTNKAHNPKGNTGFLVGVGVVPEFRGIKVEHGLRWPGGYKISELLIALTLDNLFSVNNNGSGVTLVIANARIPFYHKKPDLTVEEYCYLRRGDGLPYDPVLRFHKRMGAEIIKPVKFSMEDDESLNAGCWVLYKNPFKGY